MTDAESLAPVRRSVRVAANRDRAFELFTGFEWWPKSYSILETRSPQTGVVLELSKGGRWFERGEDGSEADWGKLLVVEKPSRLVLTWQLGADYRYHPEHATEVEVNFVPDGTKAVTLTLEHRHFERFGAAAEAVRASVDGPQGWEGLLKGYADAVSG
ncbi:Uncharacterized conserved protein YndB, AHSA1/START domain [Rhizobiales bacterium GAS188]|nr:Uncharacterized conserved protein YndB, AHSA1/START domain [Rhizobiales bacterium GAS188]